MQSNTQNNYLVNNVKGGGGVTVHFQQTLSLICEFQRFKPYCLTVVSHDYDLSFL